MSVKNVKLSGTYQGNVENKSPQVFPGDFRTPVTLFNGYFDGIKGAGSFAQFTLDTFRRGDAQVPSGKF